VLVRGGVVHNKVDVEVLWNVRVNMAQKLKKFLMAMTPFALTNNSAVGNIERGEQCCCAILPKDVNLK
jgi:hypothetical protein